MNLHSQANVRHVSVAATYIVRQGNNTDQTPLLEGVYLVKHTSLYFGLSLNTELTVSHLPHIYWRRRLYRRVWRYR